MTGDELPEGWSVAKLGKLGTWSGGGTPSKANPSFWTDYGLPWVSPKDMKAFRVLDSEDHITPEAVQNSAAKLIPANSVLMVTRSGILAHTFPIAINAVDVTVNQDLKTLTAGADSTPDYIAWFLRARSSEILTKCAKNGTTVASIDTGRLKNLDVPLPPLDEQRRIVERIETLFAQLDKGEEAVREVQGLLARWRRATLKAAVTGELTREWREAQTGRLEHGRDLLARILETRREQWEGRGRYKEPTAPNVSGLPELPEGWAWASLAQLLRADLKNGRSVPDGTGFPVLRLTAISESEIDTSECKLGNWSAEEAAPFLIAIGDLLVSRGNGSKRLVGRGGLVRTIDRDVAFPDTMIRIPLNSSALVADWFVRVWNSFMREQIEAAAKTTAGIYKINQRDLGGFRVPVPPIEEQQEIAALVEAEFANADAVEDMCKAELKRSASLRRSILRDAFAGRLTAARNVAPQDAPAEASA